MNEKIFSNLYRVRKLGKGDTERILALCEGNPLYYRYCPPFVTAESIEEDMTALPPGMSPESKFYAGYFEGDRLIAVLDLIDGYPEKDTVFLGFFMCGASVQKHGVGTQIIGELTGYLKASGFARIRLAWVKGNPQAEHFWLKNGFAPVRETESTDGHRVILAEKIL